MPLDENKRSATDFRRAARAPATASDPEKPAAFDPANSFGSLTAGPQRFTFFGDTQHSAPELVEALRDNVPQMARSGVKHLMIEYMGTKESRQIVRRLYSEPPQITSEEFMARSGLFASAMARDPALQARSGLAYAGLILNARDNGIRIHFTGDDRGDETYLEKDAVEAEQRDYIAENPALHDLYTRWIKNEPILDGRSPENARALVEEMAMHGDMLFAYAKRISSLYKQATADRLAPDAEEARADRMLTLAKGEKTVVFWGQDHFSGKHGIESYIAQKLQAQAAREGLAPPPPTRRMDLYVSQEAQKKDEARTDTVKESHSPEAVYYADERRGERTLLGRLTMDEVEPKTATQGSVRAIQGPAP